MTSNTEFIINLENLRTRINTACERSGRDAHEVDLMAVTKTNPALAVEWALEAGLMRIGENRVQEAHGKRPEVVQEGGFWELIGPLQTNKARTALEVFDRIQTLDRLKLVGVLDRLCGELGKQEFPVLLQVNVSEDPAKHGCEVSMASELAEAIRASRNLHLDGLMTIGIFTPEEALVRRTFIRLRELRDRLEGELGISLPVLSMGMTGDLEWAIEEGSTLIRVGTALFGAR